MENQTWDMYTYILETADAIRHIVEHQQEIMQPAMDYLADKKISQIYLVGSGTSYHASLAAKNLLEDLLCMKVFPMYPMEFVDNEKVFCKETLVVGISQVGRSSSTIQALDKARAQGFPTIAITAEHPRPIEEHADCLIPLDIGYEYATAKTKGYVASIATLDLFGMNLAQRRGLLTQEKKDELTARMLATTDQIPQIAPLAWDWYKANREQLMRCRRIIVMGYEGCMSAMLEGTLKILEAVRYSVTGYEFEEFMHGIYHAIDKDTYMIYIGSDGKHFTRMVNMMHYFADHRDSKNYMLTSDPGLTAKENFVFPFKNDPYFESMEYIVPLQVLARKLSLDLGIDCNVPSDPNFHRAMGSYTYEKKQ